MPSPTNSDLWRAIGADAARKGYDVRSVLDTSADGKRVNPLIREGYAAGRAKKEAE